MKAITPARAPYNIGAKINQKKKVSEDMLVKIYSGKKSKYGEGGVLCCVR